MFKISLSFFSYSSLIFCVFVKSSWVLNSKTCEPFVLLPVWLFTHIIGCDRKVLFLDILNFVGHSQSIIFFLLWAAMWALLIRILPEHKASLQVKCICFPCFSIKFNYAKLLNETRLLNSLCNPVCYYVFSKNVRDMWKDAQHH